jgi:hypothetical protein
VPGDPSIDERAAEALREYGGAGQARAEALVTALRSAAADEALRVVTGDQAVFNSLVDTRVERLRQLVEALAEQATEAMARGETSPASLPLPTHFELAAIWRITPTQARSLLRTWRARYPQHYEQRMRATVATGTKEPGGPKGKETWIVELTDPAALDYADELARRRGLSKGLKVDRIALTIEAPQASRTIDGEDLVGLLGVS